MNNFHHDNILEKSKLLRLFRTFSKKELKKIDRFLQLFYSTKYIALALFEYLNENSVNFSRVDFSISWQKIHHDLYPEINPQKKDLINLQNSASDLYGYIMKYLVWEQIDEGGYEVELLTLRALRKRAVRKDYFSYIKRTLKSLDRKNPNDFWLPIKKVQLLDLYYYSTDVEKLDVELDTLNQADQLLTQAFLRGKLKLNCELSSRKNLLQTDHSPLLMKTVLELAKHKTFSGDNILQFYHNAYHLIQGGGQKEYNALFKLLNHDDNLDKKEQLIIWIYLFNFTATQFREGSSSALKKSFELYKMGLRKKLFTVDGYFPDILFLNIINLGCQLGVHAEIRQFITDWGYTLKPKVRKHTLLLAKARLSFEQKEYHKTIQLCKQINLKNASYLLQSKLLEIRSYFELQEQYEKTFSRKCIQLEKYFQTNKLLAETYNIAGQNFLVFLKLLQQGFSKIVLKNELQKLQPILAKDWLLSKIEERA